ncbi:MAG: sigma-54 dependent transcriptional regulator [Acidobacteriota bacterium]|nr:sigma-54 dependent transcriptional regulator [Acidobacteriota bacterium]
MSTPRGAILLVDDEAYVRNSLADLLGRRGFDVRTAASVTEALTPSSLAGLDAVVTDLRMPGEGGRELIAQLQEREPHLPIVVLTAHGTVDSAVQCVKAGVFDYLLKPADPEELEVVLERALGQAKMRRELDYLRASGSPGRRRPMGNSKGWREVLELAEQVAPAATSVLLVGESGTGKEVVSRYLHDLSPRRDGAFVSVNCAAIPAELFESEFFGHRRGAFTGAVSDREGRFRVADGGTLFLDEVNSLPEVAQAKVLRVIQDGTFERLGDSRPTRVDVRLVCASNTDLAAEVEAGRFRKDLYYRINVMTLRLPPLRDRRDDIPLFAQAFLEEFAERLGKPVRGVEPAVLEAMASYSWPGNVRELRNVVERGVLLARGEELTVDCLPAELREVVPESVGADGDSEPAEGSLELRANVLAAERRILERALEEADGVRRQAARLLGIDERNLAYFLRKHGLMEKR